MQDHPTFRTTPLAALRDIEPVIARLQDRGRLPPHTVVARPGDEWTADLVGLHRDEFPIDSTELEARILGKSALINFDPELSRAIELEQSIVAAGLSYRIEPDGAFLYAVVVARRYRGSWVTPLIKHACFAAMAAAGIAWFEFKAMNRGADTLKHARRLGASAIDDQYLGIQLGA